MAYITIGSRFKPFSYQELLAPLQQSTEAQQSVEEGLGELDAKASIWESMASEQRDPESYQRYKNYSDQLRSEANLLAEQGLTPQSRQNLLKMRQRYSSQIVPIEQSYNRRRELINEKTQAVLRDPTLLYDRDPSQMSLDELVRNPALNINYQSGAALEQQSAQTAKNLSNVLQQNQEEWKELLGLNTFESIRRSGFSTDQILQTLANHPNQPIILANIRRSVLAGSGIEGWQNEGAIRRAMEHIDRGLYSAIGDYKDPRIQLPMGGTGKATGDPTLSGFIAKYPSREYFDVSGYSKPLSNTAKTLGIRPDNTIDDMQTRKIFGANLDQNPLANWELKAQLEAESLQKYPVGGITGIVRADPKTGKAIIQSRGEYVNTMLRQQGINPDSVVSNKEAEVLQGLGVTSQSTYEDTIGKLQDGVKKQAVKTTGYEFAVTDPEVLSKAITGSISMTMAKLPDTSKTQLFTRLNSDFSPRTSETKLKKIDSILENFVGMEYIPATGIVVTTGKGKDVEMYKLVPHILSAQVGRIMDQFDPKIQQYIDQGKMREAQTLIEIMMSGIIPQLTHGKNVVQAKTGKLELTDDITITSQDPTIAAFRQLSDAISAGDQRAIDAVLSHVSGTTPPVSGSTPAVAQQGGVENRQPQQPNERTERITNFDGTEAQNVYKEKGASINNPFSIKTTSEKWQGSSGTYTSASGLTFVKFNSPYDSIRAAMKILAAYSRSDRKGGGVYTLQDIADTWLTNADVGNNVETFADNLARDTGFTKNDPIIKNIESDPLANQEAVVKLIKSLAKRESSSNINEQYLREIYREVFGI